MKERIYAIDLMKFVAVLFITNSHFVELYKDINPALATLGSHGNALFFFASGFTLSLKPSKERGQLKLFPNWYKNRLRRIWPTMLVWTGLSNLIWMKDISFYSMFFGYEYWFLQCILYSYVILYFFIGRSMKVFIVGFIISVIIPIVDILVSPKAQLSIFHSFHWDIYIGCMFLGVYCAQKRPTLNNFSGFVLTVISFFLYFIIMRYSKGQVTDIYYMQLLCLFPMYAFLYFFFAWVNGLKRIYHSNLLFKPIYVVGALSLEIYMVQFMFLTDRFNSLFPLNFLIVPSVILIVAYGLRIVTNFFNQTLSVNLYSWKELFRI